MLPPDRLLLHQIGSYFLIRHSVPTISISDLVVLLRIALIRTKDKLLVWKCDRSDLRRQ